MKSKLLSLGVALLVFAATAGAAVTLRYYNKDSKTHTFRVKISGSYTTVEFGSSRTASVTIQGGDETAIIYTNCGEVKVKQGDNIEIKDGCIVIK